MTKLSQLIERNRRHSDTPYILLLECALPNGVILRFARDTQSWVWPLTGSVHGDLTYPGHSLEFTTEEAGLTLCVLRKWRGHVGLDARQADGSWSEVVSYTQRVEESHDVPPGAYRLCARENFRAKASCHLGPLSMPLWQSMAFDFDEFKSGQDARRGTLTISVSNASGLPLKYVDELEDWRKKNGRLNAKVRLMVVNTGLLDDPEPTMRLDFVDCGISCPAPMDTIQFVLGARNIWSWPLMRKVMQQYCSWKRPDECPHVAECDHTLTACRNLYGRQSLFGGFPMVGKGALYGS